MALATHYRSRQEPRFFSGYEGGPFVERAGVPFERWWGDETVASANRVCSHVFEYGGFGPVSLGLPIDWRRDPVAAALERSAHPGVAGQAPAVIQEDIRVLWELNRCHHFVTLGQAYWYTGQERYVEEMVSQMQSWVQANPVAQGPNWSSSMEVAIRIVNWSWAFYLTRRSAHWSDEAVHLFLWQVLAHGQHIYRNLERSAVNNNHYLANGVGLIHLGILFPEFKESSQWLTTGRRIVFQEVLKQVSLDGVDFEGSLPYHGFVLDLLLPTVLLCSHNAVPVPREVMDRLERMLEFVQAYTKPDGTVPQLGDTDDGRLLTLASKPRNTHSPLLTLGAVMFNRPDFKAASCGWGPEAHWLLGDEGLHRFERLEVGSGQVASSRGFANGGIFCMRHGDLHMVIDCADVGTRGRGGHGHNDCLSFELFAFGRSFIVDSGTFSYAGLETERNLFRATAAHNTAMVDSQEMARFFRRSRWRIHDDARPTLHQWHTGDEVDIFDGSHDGYRRLRNRVRHRRRIVFDKRDRLWVLEDSFIGSGLHRFDILFHLAPGAVATIGEAALVASSEEPLGARLAIVPLEPKDLELTVQPGWVSPGYGARTQAQVVRCSLASAAPAKARFCLYPLAPGQRYEGGDVRKLAWDILERWKHNATEA
ncbi:MAG: alginate lyase family protein [Chloroflexota bacterium]